MSGPFDTTQHKVLCLQELFTRELKARLEQQAIDAIRPAIRDAVEAAAEQLKPHIESFYEIAKHQLAFNLTVHHKTDDAPQRRR